MKRGFLGLVGVLAVTVLTGSTVHADPAATLNISVSPTTILTGDTYTVTFTLTPGAGETVGEASQSVLYYSPWNELVGFDNTGSAFDNTLIEGVQPGGDGTNCMTVDRKSTTGVTGPTVLAKLTYRAHKAGNFVINALDTACNTHRGAWLLNGNGIGAINTDSIWYTVNDASAFGGVSGDGGSDNNTVQPAAPQKLLTPGQTTTAPTTPALISSSVTPAGSSQKSAVTKKAPDTVPTATENVLGASTTTSASKQTATDLAESDGQQVTGLVLAGLVLLCMIGLLGWKLGGGNLPFNLSTVKGLFHL